MPDPGLFFAVIAAVTAVTIILLSAAVVRRLHDTGRSSLWAVPIPLCLVTGLALTAILMRGFSSPDVEPHFGLFALLMVNNLIDLSDVALLLLFLLAEGTRGPNRYGDRPG